jgi:hypothetical protein
VTASSRPSDNCRTPARVAHRGRRAGVESLNVRHFFLSPARGAACTSRWRPEMSGACAPGVSVQIHPRSRRLTCFNGDAVAPDAFECGSACQPETAYARSRTPLKNANEPHRPPPAPGHASGDPRPRVGRFRLACRTTFERISGDSVAVEARNATAPAAYLRGNSWRTRPARFPPSPQSPSVPGAPLTLARKSFQRILPRRVALGARHAPASGSYLTASMRRSLCAPQVELRPTRRGTKPKCRFPGQEKEHLTNSVCRCMATRSGSRHADAGTEPL